VEIARLDENTILLSRIDPVLADLLRRISSSADPSGSDAATARLFSAPTGDPEEEEFAEDWREYVEPELAKLFQSALQVIDGDLRKMRANPKTGEAMVFIPRDHFENWIHGLNQARLVLAARHDFGEEEIGRPVPLAADARGLARLQMRFYDSLLDFLLRELEGH
jgi:hypothetical protein